MSKEHLFLDTTFVIALLNPNDGLHNKAKLLESRFKAARIWVTEAVLMEIGNDMGRKGEKARKTAFQFIEDCYRNNSVNVVSIDRALFLRGLQRYKDRLDKPVGLVDCISFLVMEERKLKMALTYDEDFLQAGFHALMRELN